MELIDTKRLVTNELENGTTPFASFYRTFVKLVMYLATGAFAACLVGAAGLAFRTVLTGKSTTSEPSQQQPPHRNNRFNNNHRGLRNNRF